MRVPMLTMVVIVAGLFRSLAVIVGWRGIALRPACFFGINPGCQRQAQ